MSEILTLGLGDCKPIQIAPVCDHPASGISIGHLHPHCNTCGEDVTWLQFYRRKRAAKRAFFEG